MRRAFCERYNEALLNTLSEYFDLDDIEEILFLRFFPTKDQIEKDYSYIKNGRFKSALKRRVDELHANGFVFF